MSGSGIRLVQILRYFIYTDMGRSNLFYADTLVVICDTVSPSYRIMERTLKVRKYVPIACTCLGVLLSFDRLASGNLAASVHDFRIT